jgi:single-strand selective monofunctional uracil DNA glycosylase
MNKEARAACVVAAAKELRAATAQLSFAAPVTHVYRPLEYAWDSHRRYLERYGGRGASVLLVGMNPGPFGMAQTGVPFGDVGCVRDWLRIECPVGRPDDEHPRRPIEGFDCPRGEVSGRRLWGWARETYGTPARFFSRFFVWNFCPLAFMEDSGRNRTPDKLPAAERAALYAPCERALRDVIACLAPTHVVGIGRFAYDRAAALGDIGVAYVYAPHPSPASPAANRGWAGQFVAALGAAGALG